jgi:hypothetical protein
LSEYIGQLEGEVAQKAAECDQLRARNRHQAEQIAQLTNLTRSMLAHPAFATFAEDMSNDPNILSSTTSASTSNTSATSTSTKVKQESSKSSSSKQQTSQPQQQEQQQQKQQAQQQTMRDSMDFSMHNLGSSHWNNVNFQQPTVMAVYELPSPVLPSTSALAGKNDILAEIFAPLQLPTVLPVPKAQQPRTIGTLARAEDVFSLQSLKSAPCVEAVKDEQILVDEINAAFDQLEARILEV